MFKYADMSEQKSPLVSDMLQWAGEHAEKSNGQLGLLPYEPEHYPGQDGISILGDPQSGAVVDGIASLAQPKYSEIAAQLLEQENTRKEVSRIGELLSSGDNVVLVTNHSDLIDIAVTHAAFYSQLNRMGYELKTGIIISKMVAFLAYKIGEELAPAAEVLKILENETFLSYPRTDSARKRGVGKFLPNEVDRHNKHMRERVEHRLGEGALLLALAASGTVDKATADDPNTVVMSAVSGGTAKVLQHKHTHILPVAVWYQNDEPVFEIADIPRAATSPTAVPRAMHSIATKLTERLSGKTFKYKES